MSYKGLLHTTVALHDVHQIVDDAVFQSHDHVQVPEADIGIDQYDLFPQHGKTSSDIRRGRRLAYTPFTGCNNNDFTHKNILLYSVVAAAVQDLEDSYCLSILFYMINRKFSSPK